MFSCFFVSYVTKLAYLIKNMGNILICDDDKFIRVTLSEILVKEGHSVDTVTRMPDAIKKLMINYYDLIILDAYIEGLDGMEPISMVRSINSETSIIATIQNEDTETKKNLQDREDIFCCLTKPIDEKIFKTTVKSALKPKKEVIDVRK